LQDIKKENLEEKLAL